MWQSYQSPQGTVPQPQLADIEIPAVSFGGSFAPEVELVSTTMLRALLPPGITSLGPVAVTVYNPDGRSATSTSVLHLVPRVTDPTKIVANGNPGPVYSDLDPATLLAIVSSATSPFCPRVDRVRAEPDRERRPPEDLANGGDPRSANASAYDGIPVQHARPHQRKRFDFRRSTPATITPRPRSTSARR
jgi:hypothetical protein